MANTYSLSFNSSFASFSRPILTNKSNKNSPNQFSIFTKCQLINSSPSSDENSGGQNWLKLEIGSPIIIVEAPKLLKTATTMPCLRTNEDLVKPGDVGRIVARKPKDVWAVRLKIGTFLIDGKYFKPLELPDD